MPDRDVCHLLLIRHGRTAWNVQKRYQGHVDVPLDAMGQRMAQALADRLRREPVDAVYASDLSRARQTAEPIARALGLPLHCDWRLREHRLKPHELDPPYPILPFMVERESSQDVLARAEQVLGQIARQHRGQRVAVVSHGGTSRRFIEKVLADQPEPRPVYSNINAALNHLCWQAGQWRVIQLNDTAHLDEAGLLQTAEDAG